MFKKIIGIILIADTLLFIVGAVLNSSPIYMVVGFLWLIFGTIAGIELVK